MSQPTAPAAGAPVKKPMSRGAALFTVGLFFLLTGGCVAALASGSKSVDAETKKFTAFEMCKDSVRGYLKAPGTATFRDPNGSQAPIITGTGDGPYNIISTVDSQNGFGAMLRSAFTCTATYTGDSQWNVSSTVG